MKVGDRIRVFEIHDSEMPELKGKQIAETQSDGWYGTSCPEICHIYNDTHWAVIVGVHATPVCTMVIKSIKS